MAEPKREGLDVGPAPDHFLIVEGRYYDSIGAMLLSGAEATLKRAGATYDVIRVPGSLEVPLAIAFAADAAAGEGHPFGGAVALGCVIRGETYHFEVVANESARALLEVGLSRGLPVGNGILTVENEAQALTRADPESGNKGGEAAQAMLALWRIRARAGTGR